MKTVIVDGRVLQTSAWSRGMGRYLLGVLRGLYEQPEPPRVILLLTNALEYSDEREAIIRKAHADIEIHRLPLANNGFPAADKENTKVLDGFIRANKLQGSSFIQSSLFSFDYSPLYPTLTLNACIFYDIIPLKFWDLFRNYFSEYEYFKRFRFIYAADKIFAISNSVKEDLVRYLGFDTDDIVSIDGAMAPEFLNDAHELLAKSPREYKYIMLPGGDAPNKNLLRAIRGFDIFNANFGDMYKLVVTSFYSDENQRRMREISPNVELSGQISDHELHQLYGHAEMVLFPSLDEGLGMPVLEAVDYGKKVACSSIPIFKEISKNAFHFFDPYDPSDIGRAMIEALGENDAEARNREYALVKKKFTWARTAKQLIDADIKKRSGRKGGHHSIIVEQDGSQELTLALGKLVRELNHESEISLFVDSIGEYSESYNVDSPLIFNHIFKTYDIVDALRKSDKKHRTIIYTKSSQYSRAIQKHTDKLIYVGTTAKQVEKKFQKEFGE